MHGPPSNKMQVQVEHGLSAVRSCIHYKPIAGFINPLLHRQPARHQEHIPDKRIIIVINLIERFDVLIWHDQQVCRTDRVRIPKCRDLLVAI